MSPINHAAKNIDMYIIYICRTSQNLLSIHLGFERKVSLLIAWILPWKLYKLAGIVRMDHLKPEATYALCRLLTIPILRVLGTDPIWSKLQQQQKVYVRHAWVYNLISAKSLQNWIQAQSLNHQPTAQVFHFQIRIPFHWDSIFTNQARRDSKRHVNLKVLESTKRTRTALRHQGAQYAHWSSLLQPLMYWYVQIATPILGEVDFKLARQTTKDPTSTSVSGLSRVSMSI